MIPFLKNIAPKKSKKLSFSEMWKLYTLLGKGVSTPQEYLIDEVDSLLDHISGNELMQATRMFYDTVSTNPVQLMSQFIHGLKKNKFFAFADIIKEISNGRSARG